MQPKRNVCHYENCQVQIRFTFKKNITVCAPPTNVDGGSYVTSGDGFTVTFQCDAGYTMDGSSEIRCALDGSGWEFVQPTCSQYLYKHYVMIIA